MEENLKQQWISLTTATVPSASSSEIEKWFEVIQNHYNESHRHYHTLNHVYDLLLLAEKHQLNSPVVEYAIWFHDVIYDAKRGDNEAESAILFNKFATDVALSSEINTTVQHFINCTKSHTEVPVGDKELDYFLDFDLSVLGKSPEEYDKYAKQIRQEYIHYPEEDYRKGRARVLEKFISIPILYRTVECKNIFQEAAIKNLQRELGTLK